MAPDRRCQSPISTARANPVNVEIPRRQHQPSGHRGELTVRRGHRGDRRVEPVATSQGELDLFVVRLERCRRARLVEPDPAQPRVVRAGPCRAAVVDVPVAQQQLGHPVPGSHQVTAHVLAGTHQVPGGLLDDRRDPHRNDLVQAQQPREHHRIPGVGLDPVPGRAQQLGRCRDLAADPGRGDRPGQPEPGRAGLVRGRDRTRQPAQPGNHHLLVGNQALPHHLPGHAVDRCSDH